MVVKFQFLQKADGVGVREMAQQEECKLLLPRTQSSFPATIVGSLLLPITPAPGEQVRPLELVVSCPTWIEGAKLGYSKWYVIFTFKEFLSPCDFWWFRIKLVWCSRLQICPVETVCDAEDLLWNIQLFADTTMKPNFLFCKDLSYFKFK